MLYLDSGLLIFALWIFCLIDVIATDEYRMRNLPKGVWIFLVLLVPLLGSLLWLVAGRPWDGAAARRPQTRLEREFPEYDRPGRFAATDPDDDEAFLRQVRARAEEQRRRAAEDRKAREQES
jgi:hypothetical protein